MIPIGSLLLDNTLTIETRPSKTYKMQLTSKSIVGMCDNLESMYQAIYKILSTERYMYSIYSWNYGIELLDLIGEPVNYVCAELERRITEALLQDDRITSVSDFEYDISTKKEILCTFIVRTIFGDLELAKEVIF